MYEFNAANFPLCINFPPSTSVYPTDFDKLYIYFNLIQNI